MSHSKAIGILLFLLSLSGHLFAGHEVVTDVKKGEDIKNANLVVADQYFGQSGNFSVKNRKGIIRLYHTDIDKVARSDGWTLDVDYSVQFKYPNGSNQTETGTLSIDGDPSDNLVDTNIVQHSFSWVSYANVTVTSVTFKDGNGTTIDTLSDDFHLEVSMILDRIYDMATDTIPDITNATYNSPDNTLSLAWGYIPGAEEYELEYVFVADGSPAGEDHKDTAIEYSFKDATRLSLSGNSYRISMAYPKGSMIYRVRGVGYDANYPDYSEHRLYTKWSYEPSTATISQAVTDNTGLKCYYYTNGISVNKNWTYTATFAEEGKRKEVISYFDGSGRSRQQVTINNSAGHAIVGETKYDHVGRPAVNILPTPVTSQGIGFYGSAGSPFNGDWGRDNFGTDNHLNENNDTLPEALPSTSNARKYYSGANNLNFINKDALPDAEGYPYAITHYLNDGTDRPHIRSAPGKELRYKAQSSHNTKHYYGTPTQSDVDRLFGNEAGHAIFYKKNITVDPNGQQSVQYLDARDRVVATALAGQNPSSLDTIGDKDVDVITSPLFKGPRNLGTDSIIVETFEYMSTSFDDVHINYGWDGLYAPTCRQGTQTTSNYNTAFDVDIKVENNRGQIVVDTTINGMEEFTDAQVLTFTPGIGNYTITRSFALNQQAKSAFMQQESDTIEYWRLNQECRPYYWVDSDTLCPPLNCDSACLEAHSYVMNGVRYFTDTAGNAYVQSSPGNYYLTPDSTQTKGIYDNTAPVGIAIELCKVSCEGYKDTTGAYDMYKFFNEDRCRMKADMLAFDMGPNGQHPLKDSCVSATYCHVIDTTGIGNVDGFVDSLFVTDELDDTYVVYDYTLSNSRICLGYASGDTVLVFTYSSYINTDGDTVDLNQFAYLDSSQYTCDSIAPSDELQAINSSLGTNFTSIEELYNNWRPSYGSALIQFHPEYCAYNYFCNYSESCTSGSLNMDVINEYAGIMWLPQGYAEAIDYTRDATNYNTMNPLGFSPTASTGYANQDQHLYMQSGTVKSTDPLVGCNPTDTTKLTGYAKSKLTEMLQNFLPVVDNMGDTVELSPGVPAYYSVWYVLDDPDGIADINNNNYYTQLDSAVVSMFNGFHGDGDCIAPVINDNDDKQLYFRSIYLFMREKVIYDYFDNQYECPSYSPPSEYTYWDADTNYDGTLDDGSGYRLNFPKNPLYLYYGRPHVHDSIMQKVQQQTDGNTQNLAVSRIDTLSCSRFMTYLDDKGYDTTQISIPYTYSAAIANHLNTDFCAQFDASMVDSILLCATGANYVYTNFLPDSLRVSVGELFLQSAQESCSDRKARLAHEQADERWAREKAAYLDSVSAYYDKIAFEALETNERISLEYSLGEYHYTLYYYDQAGNLVRTVPPAGVDVLGSSEITAVQDFRDSEAGSFQYPDHDYVTNYIYNSQNQVIEQWTPDGGKTYFWYDNAARLVASQNARQAANDQYSYTIYDGLGRICESGQIIMDNSLTSDTAASPEAFKNWLLGGSRNQVSFSIYDQPLSEVNGTGSNEGRIDSAFGPQGQKYIRNRVASTFYVPNITAGQLYVFNNDVAASIPSDYLDYESASHYSYDPHGNVDVLIQEFNDAALTQADRRFMRMEYEYDLVSGNVNQVSYQPGKTDEFYHRYEYDADNRITRVLTSRDGVIWERDAAYHYYPHGPLSRAEIGDMNIQGVDYAYTLQGWLKAVNSTSLGKGRPLGIHDLGSDGEENQNLNQVFAADAYGFALDYFNGDYSSIGTNNFLAQHTGGGNPIVSTSRNLYNGNISRMTTALNDNVQDPTDVMVNNYAYDQLNRISSFSSYANDSINKDNLSTTASSAGYAASYFYDPNGNIKKLKRYNDNGAIMDNLHYNYDVGGAYSKNQLLYVNDTAGVVNTSDLGNQSTGNYTYDAIGNLTSDSYEGISNITWNLQGKVSQISKAGGDAISFKYGPSGNRIKKSVTSSGTTTHTYYMRDASGNIMATYKHLGTTLSLEEQNIYGSDRLGVVQNSKVISNDIHVHPSGLEALLLDLQGLFFFDPFDTSTTGISVTPTGSDTSIIAITAHEDSLSLSPGEDYGVISGNYTSGGGVLTIPPGSTILIWLVDNFGINTNSPFSVTLLNGGADITGFSGKYSRNNRSDVERYIGHKHYELKNHLGNVLATVSDRKVWTNMDSVTTLLIQEDFSSPGASYVPGLEGWQSYNGGSIQTAGEGIVIYSEEEGGGGIHELEPPAGCYYRYCLTLDNVPEGAYISIYSITYSTYITSGEQLSPTTTEQEYCWDISAYGDGDFQVTITLPGEQQLDILNEMLYQVDLPTGWSVSGVPTCLALNEDGLVIPFSEGLSVETTQSVNASCDHRLCFTVSDVNGQGKLTVLDDEPSVIHTENITQTGEICLNFTEGSYSSLTFIFESVDGESITLADVKLQEICNIYTQVADVLSAQDFYPGGSVLPGRNFQGSDKYRYGFNGQEKDDEIKGDGNSLSFTFRFYDPRLVRFLSVDPVFAEYPWNTPYAFAENDVIRARDLEGAEKQYAIDGSIFLGPVDIKPINAEKVKNDPTLLSNHNLSQVNMMILLDKEANQAPYPTKSSTVEPAPAAMIDFNISTEIGVKGKAKAKVLGFGGELSLGASQPMTSVSYTDQGPKTQLGGKPSMGGSVGAGPASIGTDLLEPSINGNLGPVETTVTKDNINTQVTVFDVGVTAFAGFNVSLKLSGDLFKSNPVSATPDVSSQTTSASDATSVSLPDMNFDYMSSQQSQQAKIEPATN